MASGNGRKISKTSEGSASKGLTESIGSFLRGGKRHNDAGGRSETFAREDRGLTGIFARVTGGLAGIFSRVIRFCSGRDRGRISFVWIARNLAVGILISLAAAFLFYRSLWALLLGVVIVPLYMKSQWDRWERVRTQELKSQFLAGMQMVSGSLRAGYSMENAWRKAEKELEALYGPDAAFCVEMHRMNQALAVNEPLEKVLAEFADKSGVEDICDFSEIFGYAKRSGGNLTEIIRTVTERMQAKEEVLSEIETSVAAQRMEQRMMDLLLPGILLFITISSPSYVTALYHNLTGILVMSASLAGYVGCIFWSEKIMNISI